ncbi:gp26 [Sphingomonas phage PAU]|uniref:gp26 n=1 Tax=Sphingomonas phage PAU TaxID=1150991 RepID=UPI000257311F|nr:gp26 [Sphingomonas phage PAU]AFF28024.1 gp26 [Sphingomonas phage PAU]
MIRLCELGIVDTDNPSKIYKSRFSGHLAFEDRLTIRMAPAKHVHAYLDKEIVATSDETLGLPMFSREFLKEYCENNGAQDSVNILFRKAYIDISNGKEVTYFGFETDERIATGELMIIEKLVPALSETGNVITR